MTIAEQKLRIKNLLQQQKSLEEEFQRIQYPLLEIMCGAPLLILAILISFDLIKWYDWIVDESEPFAFIALLFAFSVGSYLTCLFLKRSREYNRELQENNKNCDLVKEQLDALLKPN